MDNLDGERSPVKPSLVASTFSALRHVSFRYYCAGVIISLVGSLMQEGVVAWLAFEKTGSSETLGYILFAFQMPMLLLGVASGVVADRFNRQKIILVTQSLAFTIATTYVVLVYFNVLEVWHMLTLSALFGTIVAFEIPARFAMVPQLVEPEDIGNAFSLDSLLFYGSRTLGPFLGGLLLVFASPIWCFVANMVSYAIELFTITRLNPKPVSASKSKGLKVAFAFCYGSPVNRRVFFLVAVVAFFGCYIPLMPVFTNALHGTASTNGWLIACSEVGAVVGSLWLAYWTGSMSSRTKLKTYVGVATLTFASLLAAFVLSPYVWLSMLLLSGVGLSMTVALIGSHALIQEKATNDIRGMVSTVFWVYSYFSMFALGGPVMGWSIAHLGLVPSVLGAAVCCALTGTYALCRTDSQPLEVQR